MKCLSSGMRREAVQEERNRTGSNKDGSGGSKDTGGSGGGGMDVDITENAVTDFTDMPMDLILQAEHTMDINYEERMRKRSGGAAGANLPDQASMTTREKMLLQLVDWAKNIPNFTNLRMDDQVRN